jgi:hypothetical protein
MNPIEKLFNAIKRNGIEFINYENQDIKLLCTWMDDHQLYHIVVNGKTIHSGQKYRIKKIIQEWMEGKRKLTDCGDELFLLINC